MNLSKDVVHLISYGDRRCCSPIALGLDGSIIKLTRTPFNHKDFDEAEGWLQGLIINKGFAVEGIL